MVKKPVISWELSINIKKSTIFDSRLPEYRGCPALPWLNLTHERQQSLARQAAIGERKQLTICQVFWSPRQRTFTKPNWQLIARNRCSTIAHTADSTWLKFLCSTVRSPPVDFLVWIRMVNSYSFSDRSTDEVALK